MSYPENRPFFKNFTEEQRKMHGPNKEAEEFTTVRRVYETPFMYDNLEAGNFCEISATKGIEFRSDDGYITITEDRPIVAVTVVGSGCVRAGYNIVEWWDEGENIDDIPEQLVKRQRVDNLNGMHPSVWLEILRQTTYGKNYTFDFVSRGETKDVVDVLKNLTHGYYENLQFSLYENTAHFRVGAKGKYPKKVTVRSGCKGTEDPGYSFAYYPGDYAIRLIELTVIDTVKK